MNKFIESKIKKIYNAVFKKIFNKKRIASASKGDRVAINEYVVKLNNSKEYNEFVKKYSIELAKSGLNKDKGLWRKFYKIAKQKHYVALPSTFREYELDNFKKIVEKNFTMISSVPQKVLEVYNQKDIQVLIDQVVEGKHGRKYFENQLNEHEYKNAKVIARTETSKLQTAVQEVRARSVGGRAYIWKSTKDQRTRESHKDMNNVLVFWRDQGQKPLLDKMRGNAGEFPNCRCNTNQVFEERDLRNLGNNIKVYDYRIDKVVTMTKQEVLDALEKGEL